MMYTCRVCKTPRPDWAFEDPTPGALTCDQCRLHPAVSEHITTTPAPSEKKVKT
jgi:hypothetical protein